MLDADIKYLNGIRKYFCFIKMLSNSIKYYEIVKQIDLSFSLVKKYQYNKKLIIMLTRNSQRGCPSTKSEANNSCKSFPSSNYRTEDEIDKNFNFQTLKTQDQSQQMLSQQIIWEQDYERLMNIHNQLMAPHKSQVEATKKLSRQLTQFSAAQLLFQSGAPLWKSKRTTSILQSYCRTISTLNSSSFQLTLLSGPFGDYLAVQTKGSSDSLYIFQPEQVASQFFQRRQKFLLQLRKKCSKSQEENKLSQLSQQIIFLYHEYHKMKQEILKMIQIKIQIEEEGKGEMADIEMRDLIKQLKQARTQRLKR